MLCWCAVLWPEQDMKRCHDGALKPEAGDLEPLAVDFVP